MKSQQRTQLEKFAMKQQKSAALHTELESIQKKNAQRAVEEYTQYGVIGIHELHGQGIDLEDDKVAMFTSHRGLEKFFELTHTDRDRIIEAATVPLHHKITNLEEKVSGLEGIIAKLVEQNEKQSALLEKIIFSPMIQATTTVEAPAPTQEWLVAPKVEAPKIEWKSAKRGRVPAIVVEARALIEKYSRWNAAKGLHEILAKQATADGVLDQVREAMIIVTINEYPDFDFTNITTKYAGTYAARLYGQIVGTDTWNNLKAKYARKEVK